jgi:hypothetical protein
MSAPIPSRLPARTAGVVLAALTFHAAPLAAQERTATGQTLLPVDWADGEIAAVAAAPFDQRESRRTRSATAPAPPPFGGLDPAVLQQLEIPVIAFADTPQIVRDILGPDARPIRPRALVIDPAQPYWYQLEDAYDGITISIAADRRVNVEAGRTFQVGSRRSGAEATLGTRSAPRIAVTDEETEEGMEGIILTYRLRRFPNIPYTVKIVCYGDKRQQCKNLATIAEDQALLRVVFARPR